MTICTFQQCSPQGVCRNITHSALLNNRKLVWQIIFNISYQTFLLALGFSLLTVSREDIWKLLPGFLYTNANFILNKTHEGSNKISFCFSTLRHNIGRKNVSCVPRNSWIPTLHIILYVYNFVISNYTLKLMNKTILLSVLVYKFQTTITNKWMLWTTHIGLIL
jgi:hypothetical protein